MSNDFTTKLKDILYTQPHSIVLDEEMIEAIQAQTVAAITRLIEDEIIREDEELRQQRDMLEPTYHRVKGRNHLRAEQRQRLRGEASE